MTELRRHAPAIEAQVVYKRFGTREILKGVYFRAEAGKVLALVGRNGSGKSTLLKILAGVLAKHEGRLAYFGQVVDRPRLGTLARSGLFYLPQADLLMPGLSVAAQLSCFGDLRSHAELLGPAALGIEPFLAKKPGQLSGGERRRCDLAAAIMRAPRCLLADEPFTGISPVDAEILLDGFRRMANAGCAVVISDHAVDWTLSAADEVCFLDGGACRLLGDARHAESDPQFRQYYLGNREVHLVK